MQHTLFSYALLFLIPLGGSLSAQTTVEKRGNQWSLFVDGEPFDVKGATFGYDDDVANYHEHFRELKFLGVNSIRTWGTGPNTLALLDAAEKEGIKVMLGIWMRHGRPGMEADDSFNYLDDTEGMKAMYAGAIATVKKFQDHPAVLMWGVGNEVYLNTATDQEKKAYSKLLERICNKIQKIDKNHPVASVEAWTFGVEWWSKYVPSIDVYGINTYGAGADVLPEELAKQGVDKPYIITEFGVRGEWEIEPDKNGIKPEPSDAEKYETIVKGYQEWISPKLSCLGVYVFQYADDDRYVAPWLLTHFKGKTRPAYWAIREAYTGEKPVNHVPKVETFSVPDSAMAGGSWAHVELEVSDPEKEDLRFEFYYNQREGSRKRRDQLTLLKSRGSLSNGFEVELPEENGGVKIYAMVYDTYGNVGIATSSISLVSEPRKYLVPKVELPFYVYDDSKNLPYIPSAYMGNIEAMEVDLDCAEDVKFGKTCVKISYRAESDWYGLGFVDPPDDWGDILGGYAIEGAKTFSFRAKSSQAGLEVNVGFGMIDDRKPFPDTDKKSGDLKLTTEWKKYTLAIDELDLSCIRSGFVIFSSGQGRPHEIYLDKIVFD